jgi:vitamin B12 transporter
MCWRACRVEISRNGGVGNASSVFLRGAESRFTAVYIDGVRIDSQSTGGAQWEQIPLSQIDRIEVLRGPAAAVYGSDAIGGVIQLFTRGAKALQGPMWAWAWAARAPARSRPGSAARPGRMARGLFAGPAREISDGFDAKVSGSHNPDRDGYRSTSGNARLGFRINARTAGRDAAGQPNECGLRQYLLQPVQARG